MTPAQPLSVPLFQAYRILAFVVGILLVIGPVGSLLKYLLIEGTTAQQIGERLATVWTVHGAIYIVYVVVAFILTRQAGWQIGEFLLLLVAGLIPVMIFFVEHRATQRLRAEHPELTAGHG